MKEVLLGLILCIGLVAFNACGSDDNKGGGKKSIIETSKNYINLTVGYVDANNTYSISGGIGFIPLGVGIIKNGDPVTPKINDISWSYTGDDIGTLSIVSESQANFNPNGSTGTIVVKAQYETIFSTIQIHIVP
jgi:hypothetical protein